MGRWIVGVVILVGLLAAALVASSSANTPVTPTPIDDFNAGAIAAH